jgi:hypothetical protein
MNPGVWWSTMDQPWSGRWRSPAGRIDHWFSSIGYWEGQESLGELTGYTEGFGPAATNGCGGVGLRINMVEEPWKTKVGGVRSSGGEWLSLAVPFVPKGWWEVGSPRTGAAGDGNDSLPSQIASRVLSGVGKTDAMRADVAGSCYWWRKVHSHAYRRRWIALAAANEATWCSHLFFFRGRSRGDKRVQMGGDRELARWDREETMMMEKNEKWQGCCVCTVNCYNDL